MQETHEDPFYQGFYDAGSACPSWAKDWDCMLDGDANREELPNTYNKVGLRSQISTASLSMSSSTLSRHRNPCCQHQWHVHVLVSGSKDLPCMSRHLMIKGH